MAHRDGRHREVRAAERRHAVPGEREPRQQGHEADVRAREALPEPHQAAVHLPLEAVLVGQPLRRRPRAERRHRRGRLSARCAASSGRGPSTRRRSGFPPRAAPAGAAVLRHRCAAGPRGAARGGARRRGGHGPAPRQAGERRRARARGRRLPAAVRRARRAVLAERPAGPGGGVRRRRRARGAGRHAGCRGAPDRGAGGARRALDPLARAARRRARRRRGGPAQRGARVGDAHEGGPPGGRARLRAPRRARRRRPPLVRDRRDRPR